MDNTQGRGVGFDRENEAQRDPTHLSRNFPPQPAIADEPSVNTERGSGFEGEHVNCAHDPKRSGSMLDAMICSDPGDEILTLGGDFQERIRRARREDRDPPLEGDPLGLTRVQRWRSDVFAAWEGLVGRMPA